MARITISVPNEISEAAARNATTQRRSVSAYVSLLIENDLRAAGLIAPTESAAADALLEEVKVAVAERPELAPEIQTFLRTAKRRSRRVA